MPTHVVLLRAVNVRPRWIKMQALREVLLAGEFTDVETHIQSGNVRLRTSTRSSVKVAEAVEELILVAFGFDVPCIVRTPSELSAIATYAAALESPFPGEVPRRYVTFCAKPISGDAADVLTSWDVPGERMRVHDNELYWFLTKPAHTAKLTNARLEKQVGPATTRDLKVVRALTDKWGG